MSELRALFEVNPALDRAALRAAFARDGRLQVRDVLTEETARTIQDVLARGTEWGISWQADTDGPHHWRAARAAAATPAEVTGMRSGIVAAMQAGKLAFLYSAYPIVDACLEGWDPGGPHELLLEHINDAPFLDLVREITGIPELRKADAQATLFGPSHFLTLHNDGHPTHGRRVAYVLGLTRDDWQPDWGGQLLFQDEDGDVIQGFRPRFNTLNLFSVPQWHSVSYVPPYAPVGRYAITGWFRDD